MKNFFWFVVFIVSCVSCASSPSNVERPGFDEPIEEVRYLRQTDYRSLGMSQVIEQDMIERDAYNFYYKKYMHALKQQRWDEVKDYLKVCMEIYPDLDYLQDELTDAYIKSDEQSVYDEAIELRDAGKIQLAIDKLDEFIKINPVTSERLLNLYAEFTESENGIQNESIQLNLDGVDIKQALMLVLDSYGISGIFDESIRSKPIYLDIESIGFYEAITQLVAMSNLSYSVINAKTILFYQNDPAAIAKYEDQYVRSYRVNSVTAKEMASIVRGAMSIKDITVIDTQSTIVVKGSLTQHELVSALINLNDRPKPEVFLEVEILEVNKTLAETVGIDYESYDLTVQTGSVPLLEGQSSYFRDNSTITIPSITLNAYKQDVDAKTLSSPRIRVVDGEKAKIHIGDEVPLQSSSTTDSDGDTTIEYEYEDVGVRFEVVPKIYNDSSVELTLELEVSSLGENLGTTSNPAYKIGTRVAETSMVLRNGETVILAGLISELGQESTSQIPGLSRIPLLKSLFSYDDDSLSKTDILLSITPIVIRSARFNKDQSDLLSVGTGNLAKYSGYDGLEKLNLNFTYEPQTLKKTPMRVQIDNPSVAGLQSSNTQVADLQVKNNTQIPTPMISFPEGSYSSLEGRPIEVELVAGNIDFAQLDEIEIAFNPAVTEFRAISSSVISESEYVVFQEENRLTLSIQSEYKAFEANEVFNIEFNSVGTGTSFLIIKPVELEDGQRVVISNSKIRVK
jgi:general secretion pathway protein D